MIGFYGTSLSTSNTAEGVNLTLPLVREQGTFGVSEVRGRERERVKVNKALKD